MHKLLNFQLCISAHLRSFSHSVFRVFVEMETTGHEGHQIQVLTSGATHQLQPWMGLSDSWVTPSVTRTNGAVTKTHRGNP